MRLAHLRLRYGRVGALRSAVLSAAWTTFAPAPVPPVWRPPCDVVEGAGAWTVRLEIGGVDEDALEIALYEDSVVVEGTRPWPGTDAGDRVHLAELRYGPFRFELDLPPDVDRDAVRGTYEGGLLTLVLPKTRRAAP